MPQELVNQRYHSNESLDCTPVQSPANSKDRIVIFDGLRALAVGMVIARHIPYWPPENRSYFLHIAKLIAGFGWMGVDLFFALSGFLITSILINTRNASNYFTSFYARRTLRIFPIYYLVLTAIFVARPLWLRSSGASLPAHPIWFYLFLANWADSLTPNQPIHVTGHFWTLAVEEQFYILWAPCVWLIAPRNLWKVCLGGIFTAVIFRFVAFYSFAPHSDLVYKSLFTRMDTLLLGAASAILVSRRDVMRTLKPFWGIGALVLILVPCLILAWQNDYAESHRSGFMQTIGYSIIAAGFACTILWAYTNERSSGLLARVLRSKPLTSVGQVSYGMYLIHLPWLIVVWQLFNRVFHTEPNSSLPLAIAATAFLAATTYIAAKLSFDHFEAYFNRQKSRFKPRYVERPSLVRCSDEPQG